MRRELTRGKDSFKSKWRQCEVCGKCCIVISPRNREMSHKFKEKLPTLCCIILFFQMFVNVKVPNFGTFFSIIFL